MLPSNDQTRKLVEETKENLEIFEDFIFSELAGYWENGVVDRALGAAIMVGYRAGWKDRGKSEGG